MAPYTCFMSPENFGRQFDGVPLYHGTIHPFEIGDIVLPNTPAGVAFATLDIGTAYNRAVDHVNYAWNDHVAFNPTASADEFEAAHPPRVYEVVPIGDVEEHPHGHAMSQRGFMIVNRVH